MIYFDDVCKVYGDNSSALEHVTLSIEPKEFVSIVGHAGAGKTTLLTLLQDKLGITPLFEPVDSWSKECENESVEVGDSNLLALFFQDPKRWGFTFQSYAFIKRARDYLDMINRLPASSIKVMDRSVYADKICFARTAYELGNMTELEWEMYNKLFDWVADFFMPRPDGIIYLKASAEICLDRIKKRGRDEEEGISFSYLKNLEQKHDQWLFSERDVTDRLYGVDVLVIDGSRDFENDPDALSDVARQVAGFSSTLRARALKKIQSQKIERSLQGCSF